MDNARSEDAASVSLFSLGVLALSLCTSAARGSVARVNSCFRIWRKEAQRNLSACVRAACLKLEENMCSHGHRVQDPTVGRRPIEESGSAVASD